MFKTFHGTFDCPAATADKVITSPGCSIATDTAKVANDKFNFMINGVVYTCPATPGGTAVAATNTKAEKWGLYYFEIGADKTIDAKAGAANATGYASKSAAKAALPAASANHVIFMACVVQADSGDWVAQTDDLVAASDCTSVEFWDVAIEPGYELDLSFVPTYIRLFNRTRGYSLEWNRAMTDGYADKDGPDMNCLLSAPGLCGGTTAATKLKVANAFDILVHGVPKRVAACELDVTAENIPQAKYGLYGISVGVDGTVQAAPNAAANTTGWASAALALADIEAVATDHILVGYCIVKGAAAAAFTAGTTEFDAVGYTFTYVDAHVGKDLITGGIYKIEAGRDSQSVAGMDISDVYAGLLIGYDSDLFYPGDEIEYYGIR